MEKNFLNQTTKNRNSVSLSHNFTVFSNMPITLISSVVQYKNKLAIGSNNGLIVNSKEDLAFFKTITTQGRPVHSKVPINVVVMGRKTWYSIPQKQRPLKGRLNLVLTNDEELLKLSPFPIAWRLGGQKCMKKNLYFLKKSQFIDFYKKTNANVFVIGGEQVYKLFLNHPLLRPDTAYLTEFSGVSFDDLTPDSFMPHLNCSYRLIGVSEKKEVANSPLRFRHLIYKRFADCVKDEVKYLELCSTVLQEGSMRQERTGVGTISSFGHQLRFDISTSIPLLTTKRVPWKHCIEELLWFMRGDTDAGILKNKGINIWNGNTSREFLDARGLHAYDEGIMGPGYGWQWRFYGAKYCQAFADTSKIDTSKVGGVDQLQAIINQLRTDPFSRRIMLCSWNPIDTDKMALPPCHFSCQFYCEIDSQGERHLSCHFTMRSNDLGCGFSFNVFSYAVLTYIIAAQCNMRPKTLVYTVGDAHIYTTHVQQLEEQMKRTPRPFPQLLLNNDVRTKDIRSITIDDFELVGYFPHPSLKMAMAV